MVLAAAVDTGSCVGRMLSWTGAVAGVPYSHGLWPFAHGPHTGLTSSHLVCRLRQITLWTHQINTVSGHRKMRSGRPRTSIAALRSCYRDALSGSTYHPVLVRRPLPLDFRGFFPLPFVTPLVLVADNIEYNELHRHTETFEGQDPQLISSVAYRRHVISKPAGMGIISRVRVADTFLSSTRGQTLGAD